MHRGTNIFSKLVTESINVDSLRIKLNKETYIIDSFPSLINEAEKLEIDALDFAISGIGNVADLDNEYLVLNTKTKMIEIKKLPFDETKKLHINNLSSEYIIIFKIFPLTCSEKQFYRIRNKGITQVIPGFKEIQDRANKVKNGDIGLFRVTTNLPAILFGKNKETGKTLHYNIGDRESIVTNAYFLPRVKLIKQELTNSIIPTFITMDYIDGTRLEGSSAVKVIRTLVDKENGYSIEKSDLIKLWKLSAYIIYSSLFSQNISPDFIVLPSSSGGYINTVRELLIKQFPKVKIITLKKPCQKDLLDYYEANKAKYDKIFKETCYLDEGLKLDNNISDVFYNTKNELYNFWGTVSDYENRKCKVVKIAKVMSSPHRELITKIMSDFNIEKLKTDEVKGNIILLDDDIISGSTLVNFMHHTIERSISDENKANSLILTFAFIAKKSSQREPSYINGVDRNSGFNEK